MTGDAHLATARMLTRRTAVLSLAAGVVACQVGPDAADLALKQPHRIAFLVFRTPINETSRGYFQAAIDKAVAGGSTEVRIGMNSGGGEIPSAEAMMAYMDAMHAQHAVTFTTFNVGLVASAACYVFLAGQRRFATPRAAFLFHEASLVASGPLSAQAVHTAAATLDQQEARFLAVLKSRTRLTQGEAASFTRRTVILNASEARRDGITDGTSEFVVPNGITPLDIRVAADTTPLPITRPPPPAPGTPLAAPLKPA